MVADLIQSYRLKGTLGRLEFFVGTIALVLIIGAAPYFARFRFVDQSISAAEYLTVGVVSQFIFAVLFVPLCIARLRDLQWPVALSLLAFVPAIFNIKIPILIGTVEGSSVPLPAWSIVGGAVMSIAFLLLVLLLLLRKGREVSDA